MGDGVTGDLPTRGSEPGAAGDAEGPGVRGGRPRLAFYGDDFTGSTDTLAAAVLGGWKAALFMDVPSVEDLRRHGELDCIGVAGSARSMAPEEMDRVLPRIFAGLVATGAAVLHYKTCSTFDSATHIGSIGHAATLARAALAAVSSLAPAAPGLSAASAGRPASAPLTAAAGTQPPPVYIVGGQPNLGRYCAYANLYARAGQDGRIYRIDRHPTMSCHPVTPMDEADLRVHLGRQGLQVLSFDVEMLELPEGEQDARLDALLNDGVEAVLFDVTRPAHLAAIGRLLRARLPPAGPLLAVGPTGVVQALLAAQADAPVAAGDVAGGLNVAQDANAANVAGVAQANASAAATAARAAVSVPQTFIVAGSRSPVTAAQIARAEQDGFVSVAVDPGALANYGDRKDDGAMTAVIARITEALRSGRSVVAHTTFADAGAAVRPGFTQALAGGSGRLMKEVLRRHPLKRVGFAGGDTSSLAVQSWGITALTLAYVLAPGVAVCRIDAPGQSLDGVELMLKGGQMGPPSLFPDLLAGI
ncbi:four-carbon acid sugar kinase family protein [Bordetella sp. N]|uniref:four-carbon acid sugar kinase family protein n=1 Tax=Bordetella sp. N TaxID=1746199 RepID=UPI0009E68365|nr:four-carbon acid sugar kinase family protein [Bordetella sp. N]